MFFTISDVMLLSKRIKSTPRLISEELRGWNWNEPPIYPSSNTLLNVSDLTNGFCQTQRYVYLKYKGNKVEVKPGLGSVIHQTYAEAIQTLKKLIYENENIDGNRIKTLMSDIFYDFSKNMTYVETSKILWDYITDIYAAEVNKVRGKLYLTRDSMVSLVIPFYVEFPIDGSAIGLQQAIRADAFIPSIQLIAEMKTGKFRHAHELALAGYSLAYESQYEIPMDFGYLCYVNVDDGKVMNNCRLIPINDSLRTEFLEERDKALESIDKNVDPGLPKKCDNECPFLSLCKSS
ncbi:type I-A CRISPR-associated protein Cas4/Csa1 [Acidianus manzaensis]|uniref:Type I-A CRISPR-associated protein Cas4/Csa1 n=1 Tax=Acidianus manzaensis TaxID=282676 RepID=A0A1W6JWE3_9CREN|nr:type I-A CRISPR-associated protein Cas4/Csa1 [Acidianus manzaensis]ARM74583.1 type I-A CRISPR-associated protein Cas4/Csa1 [Acidianus manzaensis]